MTEHSKDIDFLDVLRNRVDQGEPLIVLGGPTPESEQLIETAAALIREKTDKPVKVLYVTDLDAAKGNPAIVMDWGTRTTDVAWDAVDDQRFTRLFAMLDKAHPNKSWTPEVGKGLSELTLAEKLELRALVVKYGVEKVSFNGYIVAASEL